MSLSNTIKPHVITKTGGDATTTFFPLPYATLNTNITILNVGVYAPVSVDGTGIFYTSINGVICVLNRIELSANGKVIGITPNFRKYCSIQNLRTSNQGSEDLNRFELLNGINLSLSSGVHQSTNNLSESWTLQSKYKDYTNTYNGAPVTVGAPYLHNQIRVPSTDGVQSGSILLKNYIDLLAATDKDGKPVTLPPMPNMGITLYWDTANTNVVTDGNGVAPGPIVLTHTEPLVYCEQVITPNPTTPVKITYVKIMSEPFNMPAIANGETQEITFDSRAFIGRYVKSLAFVNQIGTDDGWMKRTERSPAMFEEKLEMNVNNRNYLPSRGIDNPALRLQYFNEAFGSLNVPLMACCPRIGGATAMFASELGVAGSQSALYAHNFSVTGVILDTRVNVMSFTFSRVGNNTVNGNIGQASVDQVAAYQVVVFGECVYQMTVYPDGRIVDEY